MCNVEFVIHRCILTWSSLHQIQKSWKLVVSRENLCLSVSKSNFYHFHLTWFPIFSSFPLSCCDDAIPCFISHPSPSLFYNLFLVLSLQPCTYNFTVMGGQYHLPMLFEYSKWIANFISVFLTFNTTHNVHSSPDNEFWGISSSIV